MMSPETRRLLEERLSALVKGHRPELRDDARVPEEMQSDEEEVQPIFTEEKSRRVFAFMKRMRLL